MYLNNDESAGCGPQPAWFCLRSQPKREHIAAAHLRAIEGIEVFNPRLRLRKATRRGPVTFVEALFPNYLFARFDLSHSLNAVKHSPSVSSVVHFGLQIPVIPDGVIADLKEELDGEGICEGDRSIEEGDEVTIEYGPFLGMHAVVLRVLSPHQRVEVLLEMLGRSTPVVVDPAALTLDQ